MITTTKITYSIDFLCQIEILLLNILKLFKISGSLFKVKSFSGFFKVSQIPGFYRFFLPKLSNSRFFHVFQVKWQPWFVYHGHGNHKRVPFIIKNMKYKILKINIHSKVIFIEF